MNEPSVLAERTLAVEQAIGRIRAIERDQGVCRVALEAIMAELHRLAEREELFPYTEFPPPPPGEKGARRYLLHEDPGGRFALYLNALNPGNETKPHDHTTWAVVVAVEGEELNRVYAKREGGLDLVREVVVKPGQGIALMPEDIHSIHTLGDRPTRHLHLYGLALERLDQRMAYDPETGEAVPYNRSFMSPTANR